MAIVLEELRTAAYYAVTVITLLLHARVRDVSTDMTA
jgi:hypothetical protein